MRPNRTAQFLRSLKMAEGNVELKDYVRKQLEEALGPDNRWFCSQHHRREVTEPDLLLEYYIKHGGAEHFRRKAQPRSESPRDSIH